MKNAVLLLIAIISLFITNDVIAQQLDSGVPRGQRGYVPPPLDRDKGAISVDDTLKDIDGKMDIYEETFSLDSFEKAVLKNIIVDFETNKMKLLSNEAISYDIKQQTVLKLNDKLSKDVSVILTEEEINIFKELHFRTKRQIRKDKKNKKGTKS